METDHVPGTESMAAPTGHAQILAWVAEVADAQVVTLRMSRITTGALVLEDAIRKLEHHHITVLMSGLRADHLRRLAAIGALPAAGEAAIFGNTVGAIAHARGHLPEPAGGVR